MDRQASSRFQLNLMWYRIKLVSKLNREGILQLKTDKSATGQSVALLIFAGLSYGIGFTFLEELRAGPISPYGIIVGSLTSMVEVCFSAFVWAATLFLVGTYFFQGKAGFWELCRPLFFATGPFLLLILLSVPVYAFYVALTLLVVGWLVVSQVVVLKEVMGLSNFRTVLTFAVGFLILLFIWLQFG